MSREEPAFNRDIVVVGASAGGVEALTALAAGLPADFPAAVFVVLHVAPETPSVLPRILERAGRLPATHPADGERIRAGHIYVAPPDRHLTLEHDRVRVAAGPKENRHRPAVDPLFRTAARSYGPRVTGVILSGSGDDGTLGLSEVKRQGGVSVVQDPEDALCSAMPASALEFVPVDHRLPLAEIPPLLDRLAREQIPVPAPYRTRREGVEAMPEPGTPAFPAAQPAGTGEHVSMPGEREGFTCPQCSGHLWEAHQSGMLRYNCRIGHTFSADSLLAQKSENLESTLWAAVNAFQENAALALRMAERSRGQGQERITRRLTQRAQEAEQHATVLRELLTSVSFPYPPSQVEAAAEANARADQAEESTLQAR